MEEKLKVYVVVEEWVIDCDSSGSPNVHEIYFSHEYAVKLFRKMLQIEENEGCIGQWKDRGDYMAEESEDYFECWLDGAYTENHYSIEIRELILDLNS